MAGPGRRGPARTKLVGSELDAILGLIEGGYGRQRACLMAGVCYRTFKRRLDEDRSILDRVVQAERARAEDCVNVMYDLRGHEDPAVRLSAVKSFLHRNDRQVEARRAIREWRQAEKSGGESASRLVPQVVELVLKWCPEDKLQPMLADFDRLIAESEAAR